jgi:hypothetical protein
MNEPRVFRRKIRKQLRGEDGSQLNVAADVNIVSSSGGGSASSSQNVRIVQRGGAQSRGSNNDGGDYAAPITERHTTEEHSRKN